MDQGTQNSNQQLTRSHQFSNHGSISVNNNQKKERPNSNSSNQSDSIRQKRNSHQIASQQKANNKLDSLNQRSIKLPEISRDLSNGGRMPLNQIQPRAVSASKNNKFIQIQNQNALYYDNNQMNGGPVYQSHNQQNRNYKPRQSLDTNKQQNFTSTSAKQNMAQVQFSSDIQNQQPIAIGLSYVLKKIKTDRKQTDEEALIMENRIRLLKKEEQKTKKKIDEMKKKSDDIFQIKARHEKTMQMRGGNQIEEDIRIQTAQEQHESMRQKQKEKRFEKISEILLKNHQHYEQVKGEKQTIKLMLEEQKKFQNDENTLYVRKMRKKQQLANKKIQEQKYYGVEKIIERYQDEIQMEEQKKLENQQKIQKMEQIEQTLIKKLQKSQIVQHQALLQLQDAIKLKPSEYIAKSQSKSIDVFSGKHRLANKRIQLTDPDPYSSENTQNQAHLNQKSQINQNEHSKSFSLNYPNISSQSPNKSIINTSDKLNLTYDLDSNAKYFDISHNNLNSDEKFNLQKELNQSSVHQSKELYRQDKNYSSGDQNKQKSSQFEDKNNSQSKIKINGNSQSSILNSKREFLSRSANDIILQKEQIDENSRINKEKQQHMKIVDKNQNTSNKNRSRSTIKQESQQIASPHQIRGLSQQNYQYQEEQYNQYEADIQENGKKRKKSKKKKQRKSHSIHASQKQLMDYSTRQYQYNQKQTQAYPNISLNPLFNVVYHNPSSSKKRNSITPMKQYSIPTKPQMFF